MLADPHSAQRMMSKLRVHAYQVTVSMATIKMAACRRQDPPKTQCHSDFFSNISL